MDFCRVRQEKVKNIIQPVNTLRMFRDAANWYKYSLPLRLSGIASVYISIIPCKPEGVFVAPVL